VRDRIGEDRGELVSEESLLLAGAGWDWMRTSIHDLCQPLTTLQVLLYLGLAEGGVSQAVAGEESGLRKTLDEAMVECDRLVSVVRSMQQWMAEREKNGSLD